MRKLIDAARAEEGLHPDDAAFGEIAERVRVDAHQAAPKSEIDDGADGRRVVLRIEGSGVDGGWDRVQRHVCDRRHATGRGAARRPGPALPLGTARLVHMYV